MWGTWANWPIPGDDPILGPTPQAWWGTDDRDGDATPWKEAPPGSTYLYITGGTPKLYIKDDETTLGHDDDWGVVNFTT